MFAPLQLNVYRLSIFFLSLLLATSMACRDDDPVGNQHTEDTGIEDTDPADADGDTDTDIDADANGDADEPDADADTGGAQDADTGPTLPEHAVDILWTLDNTASMCDAQATIRQGILSFAETIADVDFHIAVTTTDMTEDFPLEPVAKPGHFQSTPQPLTGFSSECHHPTDDDGELLTDEFTPILDAIELAVGCTEDPTQWQDLLTPDEGELKCTLNPMADGCSGPGPELETYFPDSDAYRTIPSVLRAQDYTGADGVVDLEAFKDDLICITHVGSRGHGFEQGLAAAVKALSPEMTGGLNGDLDAFPNAGFLRENATTAVIFVSDENDCSHDGTLDTESICAVHQCTIQENLGEDGALLAIDNLREEFMRNVALSKEWDVDEDTPLSELENLFGDSLIAASIHGAFQLDTDASPDNCEQDFTIEPSCDDTRVAWSGHRYSEFISGFPTFYPSPEGSDDYSDIPGLICDDFTSSFDDIAALLVQ